MHMLMANKLAVLGTVLSGTMDKACGGLSASAAALLLTAYYWPDLTGSGLATVAGVAQPTAVRLLDGLVRKGLIERGIRAGRTMPLRLTSAGRAHAQALQAARLAGTKRLLTALTDDEQDVLDGFLDKLLRAATTSWAFARTACRYCDHVDCDGDLCPIGTRARELERGDRVAKET
jgi:DNA-binding MarR family transcriptional regulator